MKGSYHTAWSVLPLSSCCCSYSYGYSTAVGPQTGERCWPLLSGQWRAVVPLVKPWCADGDVPTAPNVNLYRGRNSRVGWHCDDEPLFGECGEAKLIVSASFGTRALFEWKGMSCPDSDASSCWLDHGDLVVMEGQCQDEFLHCTDPGMEQEQINITFRWIKQHAASCPFLRTGVVCCLPTCAQGSSVSVAESVGERRFGGFSWCSWEYLFKWWSTLLVHSGWATQMCLSLDTPFGRRSVEASSFRGQLELTGSQPGAPVGKTTVVTGLVVVTWTVIFTVGCCQVC